MASADIPAYGKDVKYLMIAGIIFFFVLIFFTVVHLFFNDQPVPKTYTFTGNGTLLLSSNATGTSSFPERSREYMFTTLSCQLSDGYERCDELSLLQLSVNDCCLLGFCCHE